MHDLNYDLKNICLMNKQGSHATKAERYTNLSMIADQLLELGYKLKGAASIKPKHIEALVQRWKTEGLKVGTIKNRMAHVRFWAEKVGRKSILKGDNAEYGIEQRRMHTQSKAQQLDLYKLTMISCPRIKMAIRLQAAFGLRREEALKFRPSLADQRDKIALKATWTKGGRPRTIPITTERQRALLDEAHELVGKGSMIPEDKNYIQQVGVYKHEVKNARMGKLHGLRHNYAQWRYKTLTGGMELANNGGKKYAAMTEEEKLMDTIAREQISNELGHGRLDVVSNYLGGRS